MLHGAIDEDFVELGFQAGLQAVAQAAHAHGFLSHFLLTEFASFAEADDAGNIQCAGTHAAFVTAAVGDGGKLHAGVTTADVQRAYTFGSVNFVARDSEKIDVVFLHVHRNFADSLHAVDGKENAVFLGDLADLCDRVDYANFVVGVHDGDENGFGRNRFAHVFRINAAVFVHRQISYFVAVFLKALAGVQHGLVFNGLGDDVVALFAVHFRD